MTVTDGLIPGGSATAGRCELAMTGNPPSPDCPSMSAFVSTLKPGKGYAMLLEACGRLLRRGVPQRANFRVLFVGRTGCMVDHVIQRLKTKAMHWPLRGVQPRQSGDRIDGRRVVGVGQRLVALPRRA
jgi:hypothetical protein